MVRTKRKKQKMESRKKKMESKKNGGFQMVEGAPPSYGVQPLGNMLFSSSQENIRDSGLGGLRVLSDETLCDVLGLLDARTLARLGLVSRALYVFSHQDFLWRTLVLEEFGQKGFSFIDCWRSSYIAASSSSSSPPFQSSFKVVGFFSDYLFQIWLCASLKMKNQWLSTDNIERRNNLSVEEFIEFYEEPNKPVIITDAMVNWRAMEKWDKNYLLEVAGDISFSAGPIEMKLKDYLAYADVAKEERPLYLFDSKFGEKVPSLCRDYEVPIYFNQDLFSILGQERPDYRWLIIGPARSGSSFHVDPNSTSAWNAVIKGSKKWLLFPPDVPPPGVHPSSDGVDVTSPVSIMEWFKNFYQETQIWKKRPIECICRAGEVMFIPNGWWHLVINIEDSIAITQNYVSRSNLLNVLSFLSRPNSAELVSGTKDGSHLYEKFVTKHEKLFPGCIEELRRKAKEKAQRNTSFWDAVVDSKAGSFRFGF